MYHRTLSSRRRAGFTLVEALVVTAILAILFGLTTAAVMRALSSAEDAQVGVEMRQMEAAIAAAKKHFGVEQIPSTIRLRKNNWYDLTPTGPNFAIEKRSKDFLAQMFPRMQFATNNDGNVRVNWNNSNNPPANQPMDLDPAETFVFFLGGRDIGGGFDGWSPNPLDPINGAGSRVQPFYEFVPDRLKTHQTSGSPRLFKSYMDPYRTNQPYVYFTAYRSGNDYSDLDVYAAPAGNGQGNDFVRAFRDPNSTKFINPNSFQIISAGRDGLFGNFTLTAPNLFVLWRNGAFTSTWDSSTPALRNAPNDNLANFHPTKLSIPQ